jgi:hypothetical protein
MHISLGKSVLRTTTQRTKQHYSHLLSSKNQAKLIIFEPVLILHCSCIENFRLSADNLRSRSLFVIQKVNFGTRKVWAY